MKKYDAELHYGTEYSHESYEFYHAFELTDPAEPTPDGVEEELAELLDMTPDDEDFNYDSMFVRLPDSLVRRIQLDFINRLMAGCDPETAHEKYKLWWMLLHGRTLKDLVGEMYGMQYWDPEDSEQIAMPATELFDLWESEQGFDGELWPGLGEFTDCEYKERESAE